MGNRICIRFVDDVGKSAVLYAHHAGDYLLDEVEDFINFVKDRMGDSKTMPLGRLEPGILMYNFIWWLSRDEGGLTYASWYLVPDFGSVDTGDKGPWEIDAKRGLVRSLDGYFNNHEWYPIEDIRGHPIFGGE